MFTLHNGDCLEYMKTLQPASGLCIVTDPPYMDYSSSRVRKSKRRPSQKSVDEWSYERPDIKKQDFSPLPLLKYKTLIMFGANHYANKLPNSGWLIWNKCRNTNRGFIGSDFEMAWLSFSNINVMYSHLWDGFKRDTENGENYHPTQKPVELMRFCIGLLPNPKVIFDPYMGSGSTGVAAVQLGIPFIGCETNQEYFTTAEKRISSAVLSPSFFTPSNTASTRQGRAVAGFEGFE